MTFRAEVSAVELVRPSLGFLRAKYEPRILPAVATVIHTTGAGPVTRATSMDRKWVRWRTRTGIVDPFEAALWIYENMVAGPHFVIGQQLGQIAQVCPLDLCAWHVGGRYGRAYANGKWRKRRDVSWWAGRWPGLTSPRQFAAGQLWTPYRRKTSARVALASLGGSVNANTWGIEVVPSKHDTRGPWSDAAWANLIALLVPLSRLNGLPLRRDRLLTHSDCNPLARSARELPWDTTPAQFTFGQFQERLAA